MYHVLTQHIMKLFQFFRPLPVPIGSPSEHKRDATMSKMVTLVPPCNPFNRIDSMPQRLKIN